MTQVAANIKAPKVMVLNGPNLNLLGFREPAAYGTGTAQELEIFVAETASSLGLDVDFRQSNHEGYIIDWLHEARGEFDCVVINPAALTHTSVGVRDAVLAFDGPVAEVHISNVHAREEFRHHSFVSAVADVVIVGAGFRSYSLGLRAVRDLLAERAR